ncbi:lipid-A-disaccharide synthase N-terminal domain-containing protein [Salegentibacter chungangensis]|uniref:Lipid-A-disaccharide synthase N-terminal domain-containing protein n=1 Tax=Salegentibacter chungangensis TaxID=1335724 RepID=A0ABW3NQV9_9FLAO
MNEWVIFGLGFLAQLFFSARLVTQWFISEKAKKVKTPVIFWKLSLLASILLFIYGYLREDLAIMLGQFLIYAVYIRNLQLQGAWNKTSLFFRGLVLGFPVALSFYGMFYNSLEWTDLINGVNISPWLVILGVFGQVVYTSRFFYQWYFAEKTGHSFLPEGFWILSVLGAVFLFTYGIFRNDPVLISAHFFGGLIYMRDLYILRRSEARA